MLTIKQGIKLSAIIDKLDLKITDPKAGQEEVGADLMMQVARKIHRAEAEIYALVADIKGVSIEEAANVDLMVLATDIAGPDLKAFFKSAVKSKAQG